MHEEQAPSHSASRPRLKALRCMVPSVGLSPSHFFHLWIFNFFQETSVLLALSPPRRLPHFCLSYPRGIKSPARRHLTRVDRECVLMQACRLRVCVAGDGRHESMARLPSLVHANFPSAPAHARTLSHMHGQHSSQFPR